MPSEILHIFQDSVWMPPPWRTAYFTVRIHFFFHHRTWLTSLRSHPYFALSLFSTFTFFSTKTLLEKNCLEHLGLPYIIFIVVGCLFVWSPYAHREICWKHTSVGSLYDGFYKDACGNKQKRNLMGRAGLHSTFTGS